MMILSLKNYHLWIKKLQKLVEQHKMWQYIDSVNIKKSWKKEKCSEVSNYQLVRVRQAVDETQILTQTADKATNYDELTNEQKKSLEMKNEYFSNDEKTNEEDNSKYKNNKQRRQIVCKTVYSF